MVKTVISTQYFYLLWGRQACTAFFVRCHQSRKLAHSTIRSCLSAIKFAYNLRDYPKEFIISQLLEGTEKITVCSWFEHSTPFKTLKKKQIETNVYDSASPVFNLLKNVTMTQFDSTLSSLQYSTV